MGSINAYHLVCLIFVFNFISSSIYKSANKVLKKIAMPTRFWRLSESFLMEGSNENNFKR